ncbi:hypothetical protein ABT369_09525 [Dactylosporangium sp. NPDC000244]|uniref:beta strand repeat-containing protein n=1 Tax=Dactylosporangium sp. NPDC000244 TaxID=3154365 RepID=UPI0033185A06
MTFDSSGTSAVCTVSGDTVTLISLGTCTVTADQAGDGTYDPAPTETDSFEVTKDAQTITWTPTADTQVNAGPVTLAASATSGLTVGFTTATPSVCTVSGTTATLLTVGTCTVHANQAGDATRAAAPQVDDSFEVTKASQTISFTAPADHALAPAPIALSGSATSGLAVTFSSATPAVCTVSGAQVTLVSAGTCSVRADQPGNGTYAAAPQVTDSFTVLPGAQTITFGQPPATALSANTVTVAPIATSGLTVTVASTTSGVCTVSGGTVALAHVGTCTLTADQAGDADWAAAPQVTVSFQVTQGSQTIAFTPPAATALPAGPVTVTATATSGLAVSFGSTTQSVCTVSGNTVTLVAAGACTITADQAGSADWSAATQVTGTFNVTTDTQTITFGSLAGIALSDGPQPLAATATSGLAVAFTSATPGVCTVSGSTVTPLAAGTCTINADQPGNTTYAAAPQVQRSLTIAPGSQTITFAQPAARLFTDAPLTLSATASSALPVAFTSETTAVCTVSGATVTAVTVGTCTIDADQAGNSDWTAAPAVTRSFAIGQGTQTIAFTALNATAVNEGPVTLAATASSGLPITYASTTQAVCTVSGAQATLLTVGTCTITADQPGNANYAAAPQATAGFAVLQAPAPVTLPATAPPAPDGALTGATDTTPQPGQTITITGSGYKPNTTITVAIYSTPVTVGTVTTDGTGAFSATVTVPAGLAPGSHTLVAAGLAPDNTVRYLTAAVTVVPTAVATGPLPVTGAAVTGLAQLGSIAVIIGVLLTALGHRWTPRRYRSRFSV